VVWTWKSLFSCPFGVLQVVWAWKWWFLCPFSGGVVSVWQLAADIGAGSQPVV